MSDGVPKSRVTLTYDTKQPEGREKPRELPFRLLVLGDVGGEKSSPLEQRKVRQLNGRNLGEVMKGLKIKVRGVDLGADRQTDVLIDSMSSFAPDDVLRLLTGQKAKDPPTSAYESGGASGNRKLEPMLRSSWGDDATPQSLWPGDGALMKRWAEREKVVSFQKQYQNSKILRTALKRFSAPPAANDTAEQEARKAAIDKLKAYAADAVKAQALSDEATRKAADAAKAEKLATDAAKAVTGAAPQDLAAATANAKKLGDEAAEAKKVAGRATLAALTHAATSAQGRADAAAEDLAAATAKAKELADASTKSPNDAAAKKLADDAAKEVVNATTKQTGLADAASKAKKLADDAAKGVS